MPDCLDITAESEDGLVMGLQHKSLPIHGVQFHPESIASEHGHALLKNFLELAKVA
jgi:anthranilate synthase component 2